MSEPVSRFEFRVIGQCFGHETDRLRSMAPCETIKESREIYLLGHAGITELNLKIRDGRLELKQLAGHYQDLQRWQPAGQWEFPVASGPVRSLLPDSGESLTIPPQLNRDELLQLAARPELPLYRASVFKRRFLFNLPDCRAELDELLVNGAAIASLAMESVDPQVVLALRSLLKLEDRENVAYPLALCRIMGLAPQPEESGHA
jgi:hypothetical protein